MLLIVVQYQLQDLYHTQMMNCTPQSSLTYSYTIDVDNDGSFGSSIAGTDASGNYPLGTHKVVFTVKDGCGNLATQERLFTIVNLKTAQPYCLDNVSVPLTMMDPDGDGVSVLMAMVTPDIIDGGSSHSCGYDITLSFSADVNDTLLVLDIDDLGSYDVQLWVTDENGNADYCETTLDVQYNTAHTAMIQGAIYTENSEEVENVIVGLMNIDALYDMTSDLGTYAFDKYTNRSSI